MKGMLKTLALAGLIVVAAAAGVVWSGAIYIGADQPHLAPVHALLTLARERSIAVRAEDIRVPPLDDEALVRGGAGNYDAMCVGCHLAPGVEATELNQGLYPQPPELAERGSGGDPAGTFWVIKHGIKASGMPAWGKSMDDPYIWELVAFLERLPRLDAQGYQALVAASGGHRHGGSETDMHSQGRRPEQSGQAGGGHHGAMPAEEKAGHHDHSGHAH